MGRTAQRLIVLAGVLHDEHGTEGMNAETVMASRFGARCMVTRGLGSGIAGALLLAGLQAHAQDRANVAAPPAEQVCPPPIFAALAFDDPLFARARLGIVDAWRKAKIPVELHADEAGGHGFAMGKPGTTTTLLMPEFLAWMQGRGLLARIGAAAR